MTAPLYTRPDALRRREIVFKRGQIVELVVSVTRDPSLTETYRGTIIGPAVNVAGGKPTELVLELEDGRLVAASSAIIVSIDNPKEPSR